MLSVSLLFIFIDTCLFPRNTCQHMTNWEDNSFASVVLMLEGISISCRNEKSKLVAILACN